MELIYVKDGEGLITVESVTYTVNKDDIVIIPPQTVHSICQLEDKEMEYYNLVFSLLLSSENDICYESFLKPLYNHILLPKFIARSEEELNKNILPSVQFLVESRKLDISSSALIVKSELFKIMQNICDSSRLITQYEKNLKNNYEKLKTLLLFVQDNYKNEITVSKAASICAFSDSHFMKLFKE